MGKEREKPEDKIDPFYPKNFPDKYFFVMRITY